MAGYHVESFFRVLDPSVIYYRKNCQNDGLFGKAHSSLIPSFVERKTQGSRDRYKNLISPRLLVKGLAQGSKVPNLNSTLYETILLEDVVIYSRVAEVQEC